MAADRRARPQKKSPKYPWIIPTIVTVAAVIIVVGLIVAIASGIRMF
jgi:hypothetical protein